MTKEIISIILFKILPNLDKNIKDEKSSVKFNIYRGFI